jgi:hypothetical protein
VFGFNPSRGFSGTLLRLPLRDKSGAAGQEELWDKTMELEQLEDMMMVGALLPP